MKNRMARRAALAGVLMAASVGPLAGAAQAADITPIPIPGSYWSITPIPIPYVALPLKLPPNLGVRPGGGTGPVSAG